MDSENPKRVEDSNISPEHLKKCLVEFMAAFLDPSACTSIPPDIGGMILFSAEHKTAALSAIEECWWKSVHLNQIADWNIAVENGTATPRQALSVYLFDQCGCFYGPSPVLLNLHAEELRSMPYQEFLQTEYWGIVRLLVFERHEYCCALCGAEGALHAHHRTYEHHGMEHEHLEDLTALCADCHGRFHNKLPKGKAH